MESEKEKDKDKKGEKRESALSQEHTFLDTLEKLNVDEDMEEIESLLNEKYQSFK